jgi:hypothetical protein
MATIVARMCSWANLRRRDICAITGVVDEMTKPLIVTQLASGIVATAPFTALINIGHLFVDDESEDRFRFQPVASGGMILPKSYKGASGGVYGNSF